ncbi:MAPEG family protein [Brevundimonas bacteroides]|uniref:MAPEG family protein n=1 Tax=Brevundimonas bacteroides TaxID=74311 RepID=UPI000498685B|nr:MAPEG family protein [Brevundimonas bacteroides]
MKAELHFAALTAIFTGLLWIPLILNRLNEMGVWKALRNPEPDVRPHAAWAYRLANAHRNAIENLVVFAPLAVAVTLTETDTVATAAWSAAFFYARLAHAVIYALGIPLLRTIAFFVGFIAQMVLAAHLFGLV